MIGFAEELEKTLKQIVEKNRGLVDSVTNLKDLHDEKKSFQLLLKRGCYRIVVINYKRVKQYGDFDVITFLKQNQVPFALIYTDSTVKASTAQELYAFWTFRITDSLEANRDILALELSDEFVFPPDGSLKFAL
jgi:hypothetical protein